MIFTTLSKSEQKMRYLMAKEPSPIGKFLIQQNLIASRLIRLVAHFRPKVSKLEKATLGRLITITKGVLPKQANGQIFLQRLEEYAAQRNEIIHHLDQAYIHSGFNDLYHRVSVVKKAGNVVLGKSEALFRQHKVS